MRILPILFNADMVRALLEGRKTVTRRVIKPQPANPRWNIIGWAGWDDGHGRRMNVPYQPGDILYVREAWYYEWHMHDRTAGEPDLPGGRYSQRYIFKADQPDYPVDVGVGPHGWKPSIHMPKEAARIFLRVKSVKVEQLQDITEEQARAEGARPVLLSSDPENTPEDKRVWHEFAPALSRFIELWNSTIKPSDRDKYGWDADPWVWVIEFERVKRPEGWSLGISTTTRRC